MRILCLLPTKNFTRLAEEQWGAFEQMQTYLENDFESHARQ